MFDEVNTPMTPPVDLAWAKMPWLLLVMSLKVHPETFKEADPCGTLTKIPLLVAPVIVGKVLLEMFKEAVPVVVMETQLAPMPLKVMPSITSRPEKGLRLKPL